MSKRQRETTRVLAAATIGLLCTCLLAPHPARADGCYFPEKAVRKMPAIPLQRAILVHKDQTERLIIESTLDAEGQRFGWIVPVPGKPTEITKVSRGLLSTLSLHTQSGVTHDLSQVVLLSGILAGAMAVWAISVLLRKSPSRGDMGRDLLRVLGLLGFLLLLHSMLLSAGSSGDRANRLLGIDVQGALVVGNYDVAVLKAERPDALGQWLEENGFASLPDQGQAIMADYIRQGWYFVTAKLQREGDGMASPHPLSISFASSSAIYPMRLTALAGCPVGLDLHIVADRQAVVGDLDTEFCDVLRRDGASGQLPSPRYTCRTLGTTIAHPHLDTILWDGCCLTRLSGIVQPEDMRSDIALTWQKPSAHRQHLFSRSGAREVGMATGLLLWAIGIPVSFLAARYRAADRPWRSFCLKRVAVPITLACLLAGTGIAFALPKTDVEQIGPARVFLHPFRMTNYSDSQAVRALAIESGGSIGIFRQSLRDYLRYRIVTNRYTYGRMTEEDSPGNYAVESDIGRFLLIQYELDMGTTVTRLPAEASAYPTERSSASASEWFDLKEYQSQKTDGHRDAQQFEENPSPKAWKTLMARVGPFGLEPFARCMEIVRLGRQLPQSVVPMLVQEARELLQFQGDRIQYERIQTRMELLGYIIQVSPPLEFYRQPQAEQFLQKAESVVRRAAATQPGTSGAVPGG